MGSRISLSNWNYPGTNRSVNDRRFYPTQAADGGGASSCYLYSSSISIEQINHRHTTNINIISQFLWVRNVGAKGFWLRLCHGLAVQMVDGTAGGSAFKAAPQWVDGLMLAVGWRPQFLIPGPPHRLSECPQNMAAHFPQSKRSKREPVGG